MIIVFPNISHFHLMFYSLLNMFSFALLFFLANIFMLTLCEKGPIVNTPLGPILGKIQTSRNGIDYYSFQGIHYAKAPDGPLRFKPPAPVEPWKTTLNATQEPLPCLPDTTRNMDCLFLNVYARYINEEKALRPVLVFIHDGNFNEPIKGDDLLGPDYLMDHDIVLVTVSFRVHVFGFFSTGDKNAPGNYGLKDQVEALKWVKNNIKSFGGNPNQVTISGKEAGGASVGLHMVSPMSRGLFHGAMILSGSPINPWIIDKDPAKGLASKAELFGCAHETPEKALKCLTELKDHEDTNYYFYGLDEMEFFSLYFSPVIEVEHGGKRFLEKDPVASIMKGDFAQVPVFIGTTKYEEVAEALNWQHHHNAEDLSQNWTTIIPKVCVYEPNDTISNKLREFYLGSSNAAVTTNSTQKLMDLFSDARIIYGVIQFAKLIAGKNSKPVYLYQYNYGGKSILNFLKEEYRGEHVSDEEYYELDMYYIFDINRYKTKFLPNTTEGRFVTKMTTLWKNFVASGNPTPDRFFDLDDVIWEPFTNKNPKYLNINGTLTLEYGLYFKERMEFWEKLFPLPGQK